MDLILAANWFDQTFSEFDYSILYFMHRIGEITQYKITAFWEFISVIGEAGLGLLGLSLILMVLSFMPFVFKNNPEKRKILFWCGLTEFLAMGIGFLITNKLIKVNVNRPRPYIDPEGIYREWWSLVGAHLDSEASFPSGHTTAATGAMTPLFFYYKKKYSWTAFIFVMLMGMSRMYLMMHYPSDILGGFIVGFTASVIAYFICKLIRMNLKEYKKNPSS